MANTKYTYTISTAFSNGVAADRLTQEIQTSAIVIALDHIATSGDDCDIWFKDPLSGGDQTILNGLVAAHSGLALPDNTPQPVQLFGEGGLVKQNPYNELIVVQNPRIGSELIVTTHNLCDRTTWYSQSVRVTGEILTNSGDGYKFTSNHLYWINMVSGKLFDEDALCADASDGYGYSVAIKIDGYVAVARAPFTNSGGDYTINYRDGYITFLADQTGKTITADYSYENGSAWILNPDAGKIIEIESAEVQFSSDVILNDTVVFEIWVYNPYDLPNKFLYQSSNYKKMINYIDEAIGSFPLIPAIGGAVRGTQNSVYGFPFRYSAVRQLTSSMGVELRVRLQDNVEFGGEHATGTFYCTVRDI